MSRVRMVSLFSISLTLSLSALAQQEPVPWTPDREPWTTQDIIDARIDVHAQYSLMRMFGGDAFERYDASAMLSAVKSGELAGIYIVDQRAAALRAQEIGKSWWTVLPSGIDAICLTQPESKPPLIAFSKSAHKDQHLLDSALRSAWASCGLEAAPPRPYTATLPPKQPRETRPCAEVGDGAPSIVVTVVDALTLNPHAGATVTVSGLNADCSESLSAPSDEGGAVLLSLPCAGDYSIEATTKEGLYGSRPVRTAGNCAYGVVLSLRPRLQESGDCDWDSFYRLLKDCEAVATAGFQQCSEDARVVQPRDMLGPEGRMALCIDIYRNHKAGCESSARQGAGCE